MLVKSFVKRHRRSRYCCCLGSLKLPNKNERTMKFWDLLLDVRKTKINRLLIILELRNKVKEREVVSFYTWRWYMWRPFKRERFFWSEFSVCYHVSKEKADYPIGIGPMTASTLGGLPVHWATIIHGEQCHLTKLLSTKRVHPIDEQCAKYHCS